VSPDDDVPPRACGEASILEARPDPFGHFADFQIMPLLSTAPWSAESPAIADEPRESALSDSTRSLLGLMELSQRAAADRQHHPDAGLDGIISRSVLRSLLSALHVRNVATVRHSRRTALLAVALAEHLGWEGRSLKVLEAAALLHDIGKIGVPDNILFKPAKLSADELELMALHYSIGLDILQACRADREMLEIVSQSHSTLAHCDALRRVGRQTHQGARILAIADAYESLSSEQVYRPARPHDEIMKILTDASGVQFDGNIVSALGRFIKLHGAPFEAHGKDLDDGIRQRGPSTIDEIREAGGLRQIFSHLYLLENLYDGFVILDEDLRVLVWNRGLEALLGRSAGDVLGMRWSSQLLRYATLQGEPLTDPQCLVPQALDAHGPLTAEVQLTRHDSRAVQVELQTIPILDDDARLHGVIEIYRDLTRSGSRRPYEFRELKLAASRDALTSVANRGELETQLSALIGEFQKNPDDPFSVIFIDADHFKSVNDTFGHTIGDQVLVDMARLLQKETYSGETVGRYGGEEFVILCPSTGLDDGLRKAERLRNAIRALKIPGVDRLRVTASLGVAEVEPGDSVESVLRRADKALYTAKQTGRDKVCSLTNSQLLGSGGADGQDEDLGGQLVYSCWFNAVVAADMVVYKLGGYVHEHHAELVEVTSERVLMRDGFNLFGFWGTNPKTQPVEIEVLFSNPLGAKTDKHRATPKISIGVKVRPLGWVRSRDAFRKRARNVVRELKSYFAAD
jgi:diguanylate cyclase (GGDEF)-like protein/putative nucleotidyltransferase with HDIG domain